MSLNYSAIARASEEQRVAHFRTRAEDALSSAAALQDAAAEALNVYHNAERAADYLQIAAAAYTRAANAYREAGDDDTATHAETLGACAAGMAAFLPTRNA